jgi:hypothetical protein
VGGWGGAGRRAWDWRVGLTEVAAGGARAWPAAAAAWRGGPPAPVRPPPAAAAAPAPPSPVPRRPAPHLVHAVAAHAERILEGEVRGKGREALPQRADAFLRHHRLAAVDDACLGWAQGVGRGFVAAGLRAVAHGPMRLAKAGARGGRSRRPAAAALPPRPARLAQPPAPWYRPAVSSCRRVLMTSIGCRQHASMTPPMEPAAAARRGARSVAGRRRGGLGLSARAAGGARSRRARPAPAAAGRRRPGRGARGAAGHRAAALRPRPGSGDPSAPRRAAGTLFAGARGPSPAKPLMMGDTVCTLTFCGSSTAPPDVIAAMVGARGRAGEGWGGP